ncbi:MAG TPA: DNA-protecting protein DprA [Nitrospinae bacterium]|nr:DNA-protecting protein DprA [Nitrospinota bacterium]
MDNKFYWIALNMVDEIGSITYQKLITHFGSPENIFSASKKELMEVDGIREKTANSIKSFRLEEEIKSELNRIEKSGVNVITTNDNDYPSSLKTIYAPPPVLYIKGKIIENDAIAVAVVGSRSPTTYGKLVTEKISMELSERDITIISGMARGIDSIAHKSAIVGGGRTIAVLGCGLNVIYPPENFKLMDEIISHGAAISEFPMSERPDKMNFPQRNRIISGLSLGTLIIEAAEKSGSLITARHAVEQGREVFAVPGSINSLKSKGTNRLIKSGAKLVEGAEDIIDEFPPDVRSFLRPVKKNKTEEPDLAGDEKYIFSLIDSESRHIDTIIEHSNLPVGIVSGILVKLELKGLIRQTSGKIFVRS